LSRAAHFKISAGESDLLNISHNSQYGRTGSDVPWGDMLTCAQGVFVQGARIITGAKGMDYARFSGEATLAEMDRKSLQV
jgi:hypothetical protein